MQTSQLLAWLEPYRALPYPVLATLSDGERAIIESLRTCWPEAPHQRCQTHFLNNLVQLPGFGLLTAMTVLAVIGEITRFSTAKKLVGYAGLGAGVHDSGETHRGKGITKQGRRDLRRVMVEAAWTAVNSHPHWKREFGKLTRRMHSNQAIVAIARKLLVSVWHVLTERVADKHAVADMVAFKLMMWSWKLTADERGGLTSRQFIRYHLLRLNMGEELTHIVRGGMKRPIAPPDEVLALKPELQTG